MLSIGADILYNKQVTALNRDEQTHILKYFYSVGYDIKYSISTSENGEQVVNITFPKLPYV